MGGHRSGLTSAIIASQVTGRGDVYRVGEIKGKAFENCTTLAEVYIPYGIEIIGPSAFQGCTGLGEVLLPDSVSLIFENAFADCTSLEHARLSNGISQIPIRCFQNCVNLQTVIMPESGIAEIGQAAFQNCASLESITLPQGIMAISQYTFDGCSSLRSITIPEGVTQIGAYAFRGCSSLREVHLPSTLTQIDECAFDGCSALEALELPAGCVTLDRQCFRDCTSLERAVISPLTIKAPSGTDHAYGSAAARIEIFCGCTALETVEVMEGCEIIPFAMFRNCTALHHVTLPETLTSISAYAFQGCTGLRFIRLPWSLEGTLPMGVFADCGQLYVAPGNARFSSNTFINTEVRFYCAEDQPAAGLAEQYGFSWTNLYGMDVILPADLEILESEAMAGTAIGRVYVQPGVWQIGLRAFADNPGLLLIDLPASVTDIAEDAFSNCPALVIGAPMGSEAQRYADAHDIPYIPY